MPKIKTNREEILRTAWRVFHRHGYYDTSVQMLATAVGLGKAGLLHHFGSKRGLMEAVIDYALDYYRRRVMVHLDAAGKVSDGLRSFLERHVALCEIDRRGCFFANTILETGADNLFGERLGNFHDEWVDRLAERLARDFPPEEARERAYRLFADYEGSVVLYKMNGRVEHLRRFVDRAVMSLQLPIYP